MIKGYALIFFALSLISGVSKSSTVIEDFVLKATPMEFDQKLKTQYALESGALVATVRKSSSALVLPFDQIKLITNVSYDWCTTRDMTKVNREKEQKKEGDDAALRLGLLLSGTPPGVPLFVPNWIKRLEKLVKFPTQGVLFITSGVSADAGKSWVSPYTQYISMTVAQSTPKNLSWCKHGQAGKFQAKIPIESTGLWFMADGDDTHASFTTWISNIQIQ